MSVRFLDIFLFLLNIKFRLLKVSFYLSSLIFFIFTKSWRQLIFEFLWNHLRFLFMNNILFYFFFEIFHSWSDTILLCIRLQRLSWWLHDSSAVWIRVSHFVKCFHGFRLHKLRLWLLKTWLKWLGVKHKIGSVFHLNN